MPRTLYKPDKIGREMPRSFLETQKTLLREFAANNDNTDLNVSRALSFVKRNVSDIPAQHLILRESDLPRFGEICSQGGVLREAGVRSLLARKYGGIFIPELRLAVIIDYRPPGTDDPLEKLLMEGNLVHELSHAVGSFEYYTPHRAFNPIDHDEGIKFYVPRAGFCLPRNKKPWGWFLEEGWAEVHKAGYVAENVCEKAFERIVRIFEKNGYIVNSIENTIPVSHVDFPNLGLFIPVKYFSYGFDDRLVLLSSAFAGYAVELLFNQHPGLKLVMYEARHNVQWLRKLAKNIEEIKHGLYLDLQSGQNSEGSFFAKLFFVMSNYRDIPHDVTLYRQGK